MEQQQLNQTINLNEDRHCLPSNDKEARKLYNASYYATNREKILKDLATLVKCDFCHKFVNKNNINRHKKTPLCEKLQLRNLEFIRRMNLNSELSN